MADRRPKSPHGNVSTPGGGEQLRSQNNGGQICDKHRDAGKSREN